ncbi:MAG: hypothetical protein HY700_12015, partial [Gemmatimonadetes bacterium]|nr:hypothetical protein [Gemmatimonadota bacterium]
TAERDAALAAFDRLTGVLQVVPAEQAVADDLDRWARPLAEERLAAKRRRDFAAADRIRKALLDKGFEIRDGKDGGYELRRLSGPPADT